MEQDLQLDESDGGINRFDVGTASIVSEDDGFLTVKIAVTRPGVFPYMKPDGSIQYELKHPDDIYSYTTMESVKGKPVTDGHPNVPVDKTNVKQLIRGMTHTNVGVEDGLIVVDETVFDEGLMAAILSGEKAQVSIGFKTKLIPEKGVYNGQQYDYRQTNILVNHVAHVKNGRAGESVGVRADDAWQVIEDNENTTPATQVEQKNDDNDSKIGGNKMGTETIRIDGKQEFEVAPEVKQKIDQLTADLEKLDSISSELEDIKQRNTELTTENEDLKSKVDAKDGEIDALKTKLDSAEEEKFTQDQLDELVKTRIELVKAGEKYVKDFDDTGMSNREIKEAIIQTVDPEFKGDEKSDEYVDARFDSTVALIDKVGFKSTGDKNLKTGEVRNDANDKIAEMKAKRLSIRKH